MELGKDVKVLESKNLRDGRNVLHVERKREHAVVIDGAKEPWFDEVHKFTEYRAGHYAYEGRRGRKWFVVIDGKKYGPYLSVELLSMAWGHAIFKAYRPYSGDPSISPATESTYVVDGAEGPWFMDVGSITNRVGKIVFVGQSFLPPGVQVVIDGKVGPKFGLVWPVAEIGGHVVYKAEKDHWQCYVVDGEPSLSAIFKRVYEISVLDGHLIYLGQRDTEDMCWVIDGVESKRYLHVSLIQAAHGHVVFVATNREHRQCAVIDGVEQSWRGSVQDIEITEDEISYEVVETVTVRTKVGNQVA